MEIKRIRIFSNNNKKSLGIKDILISKLEENGFISVPWTICNEEFIESQINFLVNDVSHKYPIDGCVIKFDDVNYYESLGST